MTDTDFKPGDVVRLKDHNAYGAAWQGDMHVNGIYASTIVSCVHPERKERGGFYPSELQLVRRPLSLGAKIGLGIILAVWGIVIGNVIWAVLA